MLLCLRTAELLVAVSKAIQHLPPPRSLNTHLLLLESGVRTSWTPHSANRNSDQQFENKMCYCHYEAGCNFIGLFSTRLQRLVFIPLNVKLSSDCSGALQRRGTAVTRTELTLQ